MSPKKRRPGRRRRPKRGEDLTTLAAALFERCPGWYSERGITLQQLTTEVLQAAKKSPGRPRKHQEEDNPRQEFMAFLETLGNTPEETLREVLGHRATSAEYTRNYQRYTTYYKKHPEERLALVSGKQLRAQESGPDTIDLIIEPATPIDLPTPILDGDELMKLRPDGWPDLPPDEERELIRELMEKLQRQRLIRLLCSRI